MRRAGLLLLLVTVLIPTRLLLAERLKGQEKADSLEAALEALAPDSAKVHLLHELESFYYRSDMVKASWCNKQAIEISRSINFPDGIARSYNNIGELKRSTGDYLSALTYYDSALTIYTRLSNSEREHLRYTGIIGCANAYNNKGIVNIIQGRVETAVALWLKALPLYEDAGRSPNEYFAKLGKQGEARSYNNLGTNYRNRNMFEEALEFFTKSLHIKRETDMRSEMISTIGNIGGVYFKRSEYKKALAYFKEALEIAEEVGDLRQIALSYNSLASAYAKMGESDTAMACFRMALNMKAEIGDRYGWAYSLKGMAELNSELGNTTAAIEELRTALDSAKALGAVELMRSIHVVQAEFFAYHGDYRQARLNQVEAASLQDSLFDEQKAREMGRLEALYEFEKAEKNLELELKEKERVETEIQSRRNHLQYSGIFIVITALFSGVFLIGKVHLPARVAEGLIFLSFLLFFEFTLVLLDPYLDTYSRGAPVMKLLFNAVLAGLIFPVHTFFEERIKGKSITS